MRIRANLLNLNNLMINAKYNHLWKRWVWSLLFTLNMLIGLPAFAQQSLFNVPSVETTEKDKFFFQEQLDLFSNGVANTTLDYGLGQGWETGMTITGANIYSSDNIQSNPILLVNVQKGFYVNENWKVGIGTQTGFTLPEQNSSTHFASYNYLNNAFDLHKWGKYYLGIYNANKAITGSKTNTDLLAGLEIPITENVHIMADYTGGKNDIGASVLGIVWYASKQWQFSVGGQFSNITQSDQHFQGAIFEFTFVQQ